MRFEVFDTSMEAAAYGAEIVVKILKGKKDAVLTLTAGESMTGLYEALVRLYQAKEIDFKEAITLNVEEYVGLSPSHNQSFRYFMDRNLFEKVDIRKENTHVPSGDPGNQEEEATAYDRLIAYLGGSDIAILDLGENGRLGFNEPAETLDTDTHVEFLSEETLEANSKSFGSLGEVPTEGVTMGMRGILGAKRILLLAFGASKADAVGALADSRVTAFIPATFLKLHPDVTVVLDREAAAQLVLG